MLNRVIEKGSVSTLQHLLIIDFLTPPLLSVILRSCGRRVLRCHILFLAVGVKRTLHALPLLV